MVNVHRDVLETVDGVSAIRLSKDKPVDGTIVQLIANKTFDQNKRKRLSQEIDFELQTGYPG
jgi:hypothetical protein